MSDTDDIPHGPEGSEGETVRAIEDPTAQIIEQEDDQADHLRLSPRSLGSKPGQSALEALDSEDEQEDIDQSFLDALSLGQAQLPTGQVHLYPMVVMATTALVIASVALALAVAAFVVSVWN